MATTERSFENAAGACSSRIASDKICQFNADAEKQRSRSAF
jgi:hypothetical protein